MESKDIEATRLQALAHTWQDDPCLEPRNFSGTDHIS